MKNRKLVYSTIIILVASVILVIYLRTDERERNEVSVRLNWIPSCSFVGEVLASEKYDEDNGISIIVNPGGPGIDPIKLIQAGTDDFGVAGADLVLAANDKGADFVIVGLVSYDSPGVWLAKEEKGISTLEDIKGKRIGELPGGNMQYLYEVFIKKTGLERGVDFVPVPIPFDLKNFIAKDECDLRPVFIYDETSELKLRGIEYSLIEPKNFGIQFKGICYFTKREVLEEDPDLVRRFVNTMAAGWEAALSNPKDAIESLSRFDSSINKEKELLGLKEGMEYLDGYEGRVLDSDMESWQYMCEMMVELGFMRSNPDLTEVLRFEFVREYHDKVDARN